MMSADSSLSSLDGHFQVLREEDEEAIEEDEQADGQPAQQQEDDADVDISNASATDHHGTSPAVVARGMFSSSSDVALVNSEGACLGLITALSVNMTQVREEEQLLFDWDEDTSMGAATAGAAASGCALQRGCTSCELLLPVSPYSRASLDSNVSTSDQIVLKDGALVTAGAGVWGGRGSSTARLAMMTRSTSTVSSNHTSSMMDTSGRVSSEEDLLQAGGVGGAADGRLEGGAGGEAALGIKAAGIARSVHATDGFLWRGMKGTALKAATRTSKRVGRHAPQVYPPPVLAAPPRSTNEVLSNMSDGQWQVFMRELTALMDEALASGAWKQVHSAPVAVAMSCPRF